MFYFAAAHYVLVNGSDSCSDSPCLTLNRLLGQSLHETHSDRNIHIETNTSLNITQKTMVGILKHFDTLFYSSEEHFISDNLNKVSKCFKIVKGPPIQSLLQIISPRL